MINSRSALAVASSSGFFKGLEQPAMQAILAAAQTRRVSAKHNVTSEGHRATHLFFVQSGRARYCHLTKHGELILLAWAGPGDVIGLVTLQKGLSTYMATAEATSDCVLLAWEHSVIRKFVSRYPLLGENGFHIALGYLQGYMRRHIGLLTQTAEERLAGTLLGLAQKCSEIHHHGVEIRVTNDELGALADVSPFTASRALTKWARAGILSKKRGLVLLHAPEALMID